MPEPKDPRRIAQEEINEALLSLDVGLPGTAERREFQKNQRWVSDTRIRQETRKERRTASIAGIGYGIVGTAVTGIVAWLAGVGQWLLNILTSHR